MTDIEADLLIARAEIKRLRAERDAAVRDLNLAGMAARMCSLCRKKYYCKDCLSSGRFEWQGPQEATHE